MNNGEEKLGTEDKYYLASQWQLVWWKFKKHRLAVSGGIILVIFYLIAML